MSIYVKLIFTALITAALASCGGSDSDSNNEGAVVIIGSSNVGDTLNTSVVDDDGVPATVAYQWAADGVDIAGATADTYTVTANEAGAALTVTATYTDDEGNDEVVTSGPTAVVPVPVNTDGIVSITGTTTVGDVLTAAVVDANGVDLTAVSYQWSTDTADIAGANGDTFTLTDTEIGENISVTATYTDNQGFVEAPVSAAVGPVVQVNTVGTVAITGTAQVGQDLTATVTDANDATGTITYEWFAGAAAIAGATTDTLTLSVNEIGEDITVTATYTDDDGYSESPTSAAVGPVIAVPNNPGSVAISGTTEEGETLTATVTDADNFDAAAVTYEWFADDGMGAVAIAGADEATYLLTSDEVGDNITVNATYTDSAANSEAVTSAAVGPVTALVGNSDGSVAISGIAADGETLTATVTDINGYDAMTVTYQWASDSADITGAIGETFVPGATEVGTEITVTATYTDDDGFPESPTSAPVGPVTAGGMFSATVTNGDELLTAVEQAAFYTGGALIELDTATGAGYVDMPELLLDTDNMTITLASPLSGASPEITGATCIVFSDDNTGIVLDGLTFDELTITAGQSCLDDGIQASIVVDGDANTIRNSSFLGDVVTKDAVDFPVDPIEMDNDPYHYVVVSGTNHVIGRNEFSGKVVDELTHAGAAIVVNSNAAAGENEGTTIEYNLFTDFSLVTAAASAGGAQVIQIGTSDELDATGTGNHTIQYNRFADIGTTASAITIESSENFVIGNTFDLVLGGLTMLDGRANTVTNNIFIGDGATNQYSSINVSPLGHVITDNFTTLTRRWFVQITYDSLANVGNADIIANFGRETVVIANNTSWDARGPIALDEVSCDSNTILDLDDNLFVQSNVNPSNSRNQSVFLDEDWVNAGCALDATSDFDGNHAYVRSGFLSTSERNGAMPIFDWNGAAADNTEGTHIADPEMAGIMTAPSADTDGPGVLVEGAGAAVGIGAALADLDYLDLDDMVNGPDVGPGTTRVFNED